jgi:hypothetical protein
MRGGQAALQFCVVKVEFLAASTPARRRRRSWNGRPEDEIFSPPAHPPIGDALCAEGVLLGTGEIGTPQPGITPAARVGPFSRFVEQVHDPDVVVECAEVSLQLVIEPFEFYPGLYRLQNFRIDRRVVGGTASRRA